jgi:acylglycerol lipase
VQTQVHFEESYLLTRDKVRLFLRSASFSDVPKANVILTHGLGEHSARYNHVAEFLAQSGYRLCAYDLRGHGRSDGNRGWLESYDDLLDDLRHVHEYYGTENVPTFFYGHSLGGQILINFLATAKVAAAGAIIASPWLKLVLNPGTLKVWLAKAALRLWPRFTQQHNADPARLSRDNNFLRSMPDLDLVHRSVSARMFSELTLGAKRASTKEASLETPLLIIHGNDDPITSPAATRHFYEHVSSRDKTLKIYPQQLHETHNEIERLQVLTDICEWMDARLALARG